MKLEDLLAEADKIAEAVEPVTVPATLGKSTVGVRFLPMSGADWNTLTVKHPPREDVPADVRRGYNIDGLIGGYPNVALIVDDEVDDMLRLQDDGTVKSIWPETWARITAKGRREVQREIWAAHEYTPEILVTSAGKASAG